MWKKAKFLASSQHQFVSASSPTCLHQPVGRGHPQTLCKLASHSALFIVLNNGLLLPISSRSLQDPRRLGQYFIHLQIPETQYPALGLEASVNKYLLTDRVSEKTQARVWNLGLALTLTLGEVLVQHCATKQKFKLAYGQFWPCTAI